MHGRSSELVPDRPLTFDEYIVLGYRVRVGAPPPHPLAEVRDLLRGFGPEPSSEADVPVYRVAEVAGRWHVQYGEVVLPLDADFASAVHLLEWAVINDALAARDDLFQLHGAALTDPSGTSSLVLAGMSGSGKSTMTLALMSRGYRPHADDIALVAPRTHDVTTFRRAFHTSDESLHLIRRLTGSTAAPIEMIMPGYGHPLDWAPRPSPLRRLCFLELQPGASPQATRMPPAEAAHAIMAHSLNGSRAPRLALTTCAELTAKVPCYRFVNGDLEESVRLVEQLP